MKFSFIIPVYNRPDELQELLNSCFMQLFTDFEIIIIEDGSNHTSEHLIHDFKQSLTIKYHYKNNEGPAIARNYGAQLAQGQFLIFTDSDCILTHDYLEKINKALKLDTEVFGGPDQSHPDFNHTQKAISYSMTSFLTTGGARGNHKSVEKFYPRSFNMGIKKSVFHELGGFPKTKMWPGEDMLLAIELNKRNYKLQYIHEAFVFHKRRTTLNNFFKQISNFGKVRSYITTVYPDTFKFIHLLPVAFSLGLILCCVLGLFKSYFLVPYAIYFLLVLIDSSIRNRSLITGGLSVYTTLTQFFAYTNGLIRSTFKIYILKKPEFDLNRSELFNQN